MFYPFYLIINLSTSWFIPHKIRYLFFCPCYRKHTRHKFTVNALSLSRELKKNICWHSATWWFILQSPKAQVNVAPHDPLTFTSSVERIDKLSSFSAKVVSECASSFHRTKIYTCWLRSLRNRFQTLTSKNNE